ncbi:hypothetical protein OGAPHI_005983 [Ogataea philodendri]|uniref:Succinate-semialdehyde dehydrogenase, mitochondrial n=1 Tax=Ogataea philodendri TaxID=1378263 RepID=A0A9P8T1C6_9ASCO|nr:uncharacterized protein OGAPHI_005983 [Ogataea philodendri]KAH3661805.1 hypothetical protein OGAPHI_005983 [Ogataea philodendri]
MRAFTFVRRSSSLISTGKLVETRALVNGKFIHFEGFPVVNPATQGEIAFMSNTPLETVKSAISAAAEAFRDYRTVPAQARARILENWYRLMIEHETDLARLVTLENGKPLADSLGEVRYAASFFKWFSEEAVRQYGETISSATPSNRMYTQWQPVGPVGIITPWNFPLAMISRKLAAALAAGCTAVVKPAAETPLSAMAMAVLGVEAGVPDGVVNYTPVGHEKTKSVGELFCESPDLKKVSFTGSTNVGKILMGQSASTLKRISMELGGNAPFVVFEDADIDKAVAGALSCKFRSSGQTCVCANRLFVHDSIYNEFLFKLSKALDTNTRLGPGLDPTVTHGPLIHGRAISKVEQLVEDATSKGATVVRGGQRRNDLGALFYELTLLSDVTPKMEIFHTEAFGPVAPIIRFKSVDEVMELANDTRVGLAAYFYTENNSKAWTVAEKLQAGMVGVNTGLISEAALPFGGVGESGFGREGSKYGLAEYSDLKTVVVGL